MNKTFKVVFNKARGALMVANEMTSSVQKKSVRTVVAGTAVALISSLACAASDFEWHNTETGENDATGYSATVTQTLGEDGKTISISANTEKGQATGASTEGSSTTLTIKGNQTAITATSTEGAAYAVRSRSGSSLNIEGTTINVTADSSKATGTMAQGVYANTSTVTFSGNTNIDVKGNSEYALGVNSEGDLNPATGVYFTGDNNSITVSTTSGEAYGVGPSGGNVYVRGKKASVTAKSTESNAFAVQAQYAGRAEFQGDTTLTATADGEGAGAFGAMISCYAKYAGSAQFDKLTIYSTATNASGTAFGIYNDANSKEASASAAQESTFDGTFVAGYTNATVTSAGDAYGIFASGDLAKVTVGAGELIITSTSESETNEAIGVVAANDAEVSIGEAGKDSIITVNASNGSSCGIYNDGATVTLKGNTTITAADAIAGSGTLKVNGNLTANGSVSGFTGATKITVGKTTLAKDFFGGNVEVASGATLESVGFTLNQGQTLTLGGSATLNGATTFATGSALKGAGTLTVGKTLTLSNDTVSGFTGAFKLESGSVLKTSFATAYSGVKIEDEKLISVDQASNRLTFAENSTGGTLLIADTFQYSNVAYLEKIAGVYNKKVILSLTGAEYNGTEPSKLVDGVIQNNATATVTASDDAGKKTVTIGTENQAVSTGAQTLVIDTKTSGEQAAVTVNKGSSLTIAGKTEGSATENAFIENASNVTLNEGATLNLGSTSNNDVKGSLVDLTLNKATLNVTNAEVAASELRLTDGATVNVTNAAVTATALNFSGSSSMSMSGTNSAVTTPTLALDTSAAVTVDGGSITAEESLELGTKAKLEVKNASVETPKLTLADSATVTVEAATVTADALDLKKSAKLTVQKAEVIAKELKGATGVNITLGTEEAAGTLHADSLSLGGGMIFLDPAWKGNDEIADASFMSAASVADLTGSVAVGQNSVVALGANKDAAIAAYDKLAQLNPDFHWGQDGITAALFLGQSIIVPEDSKIVVNGSLTALTGGEDSAIYASAAVTAASPGVTIANKGLLAIDQKAVGSKAITGKLTLGKEASDKVFIGLVNTTENELTLADEVNINGTVTVGTDNPFVVGTLSDAKIKTSLSPTSGLAAIASTGLQAMTRRADSVLAQTIADRTSVDQDYATGTSLWVDVTGERYEADKLDNNGSFKSDMGYGAFGGDFAITEDISAGAAIQYGKGTVRSSVSNIKNSIDSYGITAYGSMKFGDAKVVAEASYVKNENDITSSQTALNQSVDTDIYSFGVRGQHRFTAGQFQFVPSVGVRVSRLNTDAMKVGAVKVKKQEQTLVQVPIALRVNGFEQNAGGWSLAPSVKVAYVPTFGDKEISVLGADQTVIDTAPVQGDFGIRAQKGNLLINASFMVGGGKDGTSSVGGKAGLKYVF